MPVQPRRLHQTHDHRRALTSQLAAGEQPSFSSHRPWAHQVLDVVVVNGHVAILQEAPQRVPPSQAVVDGRGDAAAIGHLATLSPQPDVQLIPQWHAALSPREQALGTVGICHLLLDAVQPGDALQRLGRNRAGSSLGQLIKLTPRVSQTARFDASVQLEQRTVARVVVAGQCS